MIRLLFAKTILCLFVFKHLTLTYQLLLMTTFVPSRFVPECDSVEMYEIVVIWNALSTDARFNEIDAFHRR